MCGIMGYVGTQDAREILINGLKELEYRGYDSAGIACCTPTGIKTYKSVGKVTELENILPEGFMGTCGIGHTRWATHGGVSTVNAHPHSCGRVTLIHNGIIENYLKLREELEKLGKRPISQTDSEIAAMLLDLYYEGDANEAIVKLVARLEGSYAFCIIFSDQPDALRRNIMPRTVRCLQTTQSVSFDGEKTEETKKILLPDLSQDKIPESIYEGVNRIIIAACGTAMHAGMVGRVILERLVRIPVTVELASEFRYENPIIDEHTLVIAISQSGETADTLAAVRLAKKMGTKTLGIVNVKGSSIARVSDYVMYTYAGPEIAVASTKAYTSQLSALYILALHFAHTCKMITDDTCSRCMENLQNAINAVEAMLLKKEYMKNVSRALTNKENLFFIGRGIDYGMACEGSIKLKEISYIHSEAYAAGELKHGTLSLVTDGVPVIAIATQHDVIAKTVSNMKEVRARGALVIMISYPGADVEKDLYDYLIEIPEIDDMFAPFPTAVALQMIAYYTSTYRGLDVDQPRNLAKSVTVE